MVKARYDHVAALLPDGTVLVAGGVDENGFELQSIEYWNPATNAFSLVPLQLRETRSGFIGVVIQSQ
jgi:hypothetical protein